MLANQNAPRLLGEAFLLVILTSLSSGLLLSSAAGAGSIADMLISLSHQALISLFGVLAVSLGLVGFVLELFGYVVPIWVFLPILPFELAIGVWLILRGIRGDSDRLIQVSGPLGVQIASGNP